MKKGRRLNTTGIGKRMLILMMTLIFCMSSAYADILVLDTGQAFTNCYVCDRGVSVWVWPDFASVTGMPRVIPKSRVKSFTIDRGPEWDVQPPLPDLSVTHISLYPRLPSLHGNIHYDRLGAPHVAPAVADIVSTAAFAYTPGQVVTMTAHVRNVGFAPAPSFTYTWKLDGEVVSTGQYDDTLEEMEIATFAYSFPWYEKPTVTFSVTPGGPEILSWNNSLTDYAWGFSFFYIVSKGRVGVWHENRSAQGSFSFEDFYRWHIDLMNDLFAASTFPATSGKCTARVRLDRIIYADDVEEEVQARRHSNGLFYDQGGWTWTDMRAGETHVPVADMNEDGTWNPPSHSWRNQTEWSLPHELGHQLGLIDWYNFDEGGVEWHTAPDTGEKITHFMRYPNTMMHWHGPQPFSEVDAAYLMMTEDKPRGYFGDHVFAIPRTNMLLVLDINGTPLRGAQVDVFQRGVIRDTDAEPFSLDGSVVYPVVEDGNFGHPVSRDPVARGTTDAEGRMMLPNRPASYVTTLNGFTRYPNPFGNVNVVGQRGLLLIRVTHEETPYYYWLDSYDVNVPWFRGHRDTYTYVLKTPAGSIDSPPAPEDVAATRENETQVRVSWKAPQERERHYHDRVIGYRIYRRTGNDGLGTRPWYPVATLTAEEHDAVIDMAQRPDELHWFSRTERIGVTALGSNGRESALVSYVVE